MSQVKSEVDTRPSAQSEGLFERAKRVLPSGYTRDLAAVKPFPRYADHGEGCWITDVDGNRIIDFVNNFASQIHGHAHPAVADVIAKQAYRITSTIMPSDWEVKLAELLRERIPSVEQVRFMNSGTEANIVATKVARCFTGKTKIAKMEGGYHGQYDLLEGSYQPTPDKWGPVETPTTVANNPGTPQSLLDELVLLPLNNLGATRDILRARANEIAAVFIDPFRLQLGLVQPDPAFLEMLREETERLGILLIFDEVLSLRISRSGTQGKRGIVPDLTTMGKIIGGGLPVGGLGGREDIMSTLGVEASPKVKHSGTFTGNPMSMAAGYTSMSLLDEAAFAGLDARGEQLREGFRKIQADLGIPGQVLGEASFSVFLPWGEPIRNYRDLFQAMRGGLGEGILAIQSKLLARGVLTLRGGFIGSTPMTADHIDFTLAAMKDALSEIHSS